MPERPDPSAFERDFQKNNERNFRETLNTLASHAEAIVGETGERDDMAYTDLLFVLREGSHTPKSLENMQINLGLDSEVKAVITTDGSGVIVSAGVSVGRVGEIFGEEGVVVDEKLNTEVNRLAAMSAEEAHAVNMDSMRDVTAVIKAGLGHTYTGEV